MGVINNKYKHNFGKFLNYTTIKIPDTIHRKLKELSSLTKLTQQKF